MQLRQGIRRDRYNVAPSRVSLHVLLSRRVYTLYSVVEHYEVIVLPFAPIYHVNPTAMHDRSHFRSRTFVQQLKELIHLRTLRRNLYCVGFTCALL